MVLESLFSDQISVEIFFKRLHDPTPLHAAAILSMSAGLRLQPQPLIHQSSTGSLLFKMSLGDLCRK